MVVEGSVKELEGNCEGRIQALRSVTVLAGYHQDGRDEDVDLDCRTAEGCVGRSGHHDEQDEDECANDFSKERVEYVEPW